MSIYFTKIDESSCNVNIHYSGGKYTRVVTYTVDLVLNYKNQVRIKSGQDTAPAGGGDATTTYWIGDLPPGCVVVAHGSRKHYIKRNGKWKWEVYDGNNDDAAMNTGLMSFSASASATSYNAARISLNMAHPRRNASYKTIIEVYKGSSRVATKTFGFTTGSSPAKGKDFSITGLNQNTAYNFKVYLYQVYQGVDCYGGVANTGTISTPALSSYLSTPVVYKVEAPGITRTAKVYWGVSAAKANAVYRLYYQPAGGSVVDTGISVTSPPASGGYTTVNVSAASLPQTNDVTFWVVATNSQVPTAGSNTSNKVKIRMYSHFDWDVPKVASQPLIVTAAEWNRCKTFVGAKVAAFKDTDYYKDTTTPASIITNEEFQAVIDALNINVTLGDGSAIAASIFDKIKNAINA